MQLKTLIIDDEPLAHKVILEYSKDISFISIIGQCHLATDALAILNKQSVDLIFLDIQMPKLKGLDFLRTLKQPPLVIVTSAYEEYALESFELDVCDYLLKPFRFDRFLKAVNRAWEMYQFKNRQPKAEQPKSVPPPNEPQQLFIKSDKRLIQLDLSTVYYLESFGNYVKIWQQNDFQLTARTLASFDEQLPHADFFRIHKSFIINRNYINYVEGNSVMMQNEQRLPIGKNYRSAFKQFISNVL